MDGPLTSTLVANVLNVEGGLNPASVRFTNITMESDKFICIRDSSEDVHSIVIVDVGCESKNKPSERHKMAATDSAIMNPVSKVLALRSGQDIQIFNLEMRSRMNQVHMDEPVVFMKWISPKQIALVTNTAVYHWSMEGQQSPVKMFARQEECQVLNYRTDEDCQWLLLIGIDATRKGIVQLYSVDKGVNKVLDGHAVCFCKFKPAGETQPINLMCIANGAAANPSCFIAEVCTVTPFPTTPHLSLGPGTEPAAVRKIREGDCADPAQRAGRLPRRHARKRQDGHSVHPLPEWVVLPDGRAERGGDPPGED